MGKLYVSEGAIKNAITYFSNSEYASPEQLGLFFFFKSIGFTEIAYKPFPKMGSLSEENKREYLLSLYNLSALFDRETENGEKRNCLFPFSIKPGIEKDYFNPGTPFKTLLSRLRDTIDNTLVDDSKFLRKDDTSPDNFKFPRNYIQILSSSFLKGNRISLVYFAAWFFRFKAIECDESWVNNPTNDTYNAFTRVCIKELISTLKLTEDEISSLFYIDDTQITYSTSCISGGALRGLLSFKTGYEPEIMTLRERGNDYMGIDTTITLERTKELAQLSGNNISPDKLKELLLSCKQVVLYGPPGTSKSYITNQIKSDFKTTLVQFHPNLNYEQFIGGYSVDEQGRIVSKAGIFLRFCEEARNDTSGQKYLFIIDEINRGNVSKIFGEVILTLDREYTADLPTYIMNNNTEIKQFSIPSNVYILATMNSADRSIALVDYAIRRRFAFVKFFPNYELVDSISDCTALDGIKVEVLLKSINKKLYDVIKDEDILLGHSYFIPKWAVDASVNKIIWTPQVLQRLFNYYILPIIEEYTYGNARYLANILGAELPKRIMDIDIFMDEISKQFTVN